MIFCASPNKLFWRQVIFVGGRDLRMIFRRRMGQVCGFSCATSFEAYDPRPVFSSSLLIRSPSFKIAPPIAAYYGRLRR